MEKLSTLKKLGTFGLLTLIIVGIAGCDPWDRVKNAKTAAIVAYEYEDGMVQFDSSGNPTGDGIGGKSSDLGVGEATSVLGGLFSGKAVENAQSAVAARQKNEAESVKSYNKFKDTLQATFPSLVSKARFTVVKFDALPSADLAAGSMSKALAADSGADAVIAIHTKFGYVREDGAFGLSKTYQLAIHTKVTIGDKDGVMGAKEFFALSSTKRSADGGVPAFPAEDFDAVGKNLIGQIQASIVQAKLQ